MKIMKSRFNMLDYKQQLRTSKWLEKRCEILKRDNYICSNCLSDNFESTLEVHHITYLYGRLAWEYPDYYLVTLCRDCHQREHDEKNIYKTNKIIQWVKKLF